MKEKPISARTKKLLSEHQIQLKKSLGAKFFNRSPCIGQDYPCGFADQKNPGSLKSGRESGL